MSQSSSEKSNTQNSSNSQSSIEVEIPTLKLESQPCFLSQNLEQPIFLEETSTRSEIITSPSVEKMTESLVEIDSEKKLNVLSEEKNESASVILQPISLETSSSQSEISTKTKILSESPKEVDTKKDLYDPSEEVQKSELTSVTLEPISLATSSCRSETTTITKSETLSECPKESDTVKNLGGFSKVQGESESFTLQSISLATSSTSPSKKRTKRVTFSEPLEESNTDKNLSGSSEGPERESSSMTSQPFSLGASSISQSETLASTLIENLTESLKQIDTNKDAPVVLEGLAARLGEYLESIKIALATSSASQSEKRTNKEKEVLSEPLKEINTEKKLEGPSEVQKSESSMTSQPLSLTASSTSQSETITNPPIEKLTESFKQIDINKDAPSEEVLEGLAARLTLNAYLDSKKNSLPTSPTSQSEKRTNSEREVLSESLKDINAEKYLGGPSEVKNNESLMFSQPLSLAASTSQSEAITNTSIEKLTESLKQIDINKELEAPCEDVPAERLPARTLNAYLESINVSVLISTSHFLKQRVPFLKKLIDEAVKLKSFMETVNNLRHEFQPCRHTSASCLTMIPAVWHKFTKDWEVFMKQVRGIIETTKVIMEQCKEDSLVLKEEFRTYLEHLLVISEDLSELEEICKHALGLYRPFCYNFDNYLFLLHVSTMGANLKPLQEKVGQECGKFSSFEEEIDAQIKQAERQIDGFKIVRTSFYKS